MVSNPLPTESAMMKTIQLAPMRAHLLLPILLPLLLRSQTPPQPADNLATLRKSLAELSKRSADAHTYSWQGEVTVAAQQNGGPVITMAHAKVQLAIAEDGKLLVKIQPDLDPEYWLISDGKKRWSYLPGKKQYSVEESASLAQGDDDDEEEDQAGRAPDAPITERYAWEAVPKIAKLLKDAKSLNAVKTATLKLNEGKVTWPLIDILAKPDEDGTVNVAQLIMAPDRPVAGRLAWATIRKTTAGKIVLQVSVQFNQFSVGEPVPDDLFTFDPPKKAKLVEDLVIPGQPGSALLNHASPDFQAHTLSGEKVSLSDFRGKIVMLDFWATWCSPCRAELPTIAKLYGEYKDKGVVVLGINDEEGNAAKKYLEKNSLTLPTLDDNSQKAHRLYHVSAIPTVFVIGPDGKVLKYFRGGRSEETLRAALKAAGAPD
jgi:peroxiredoxin/outer membrane lipoprotein-sorting protein